MEYKIQLSDHALEDLFLDELLGKSFSDPKSYFTADIAEIKRRNEAIQDFLTYEYLFAACMAFNSKLNELLDIMRAGSRDPFETGDRDIYSVSSSAALIMEIYTDAHRIIEKVKQHEQELKSSYVRDLSQALSQMLEECFPPGFEENWNRYLPGLTHMGGFQYRFYFDCDLHISHFSVISVNSHPYKRPSLFPSQSERKEKTMNFLVNMASLYSKQKSIEGHARAGGDMGSMGPSAAAIRRAREFREKELRDGGRNTPALTNQCLEILFSSHAKQLKQLYYRVGNRIFMFMKDTKASLEFLLQGVGLIKQMKAMNLPLCFATISPSEERRFYAKAAYHPAVAGGLASPSEMVLNDIDFDQYGELLLITGINGGGKTTYLRTVGAVQLFFQLGLPVPAQAAQLSPVDSILCAFSVKEDTGLTHGKLGQELEALHHALKKLTDHSLLLFNEPVSGSSVRECCLISAEIIASLKVMRARGVWVTHFYDLIAMTEGMNAGLSGSSIGYMHASADNAFKIEPGPGDGSSHAREVFNQRLSQ